MTKNHLSTKPYKGTRDFYPDDMRYRNWSFSKLRKVINTYDFEEYNGPLLESFEIYAAKSGEEIVNEQLYSFQDKAERKMVIRPEMTPTAARLVAARLEQLVLPLKWFSLANFMRYENPQKGRLREHWQVNVDVFGTSSMKAELELLNLIKDLMLEFNTDFSMFKIKINNRKLFNEVLMKVMDVDKDSLKKIAKAIDKKSKITQAAFEQWLIESGLPENKINLLESLSTATLDEIAKLAGPDSVGLREIKDLFSLLTETELNKCCEFDFSVVRGFDYYTGTVFEVYDTSPENRRSLFGGGRYDNLVGMFRNAGISGVGFGMGDVTFQNFLENHNLIPTQIYEEKKVLVTRFNDVPYQLYWGISDELRANGVRNSIYLHDDEKLGKQLTYAEKKGFTLVLIMGADEVRTQKIIIKNIQLKEQQVVDRNKCLSEIHRWLERDVRG